MDAALLLAKRIRSPHPRCLKPPLLRPSHISCYSCCMYLCVYCDGRSCTRSGDQSEHPSGARYAMRVGRRVWSWGTVGLVVQFFNIYLTAASLKLMDPHWLQGIATWK